MGRQEMTKNFELETS